MTKLLLRIFTKGEKDLSSPAARAKVGSLSGWVGILCNIFLFLGKLIASVLSGSVSVAADAMNNLSDASSSIVTLLGFKLAEKPADEDHPYGHARYEYLSGLAVAALIIVIGFELAKSSVEKILSPSPVDFSLLTAGILLGSMAVKLWLFLFNRRLGKLINSAALEVTAADSRNDVLATAAVLLAGILEHFTALHIDGWMGLAVALFILYSGAGLAKQTISPLLGEAANPALQLQLVNFISSHPKVLGYHDLMVHDYGPGRRFATLHVEMDNREDPLLCHELIDDMERECLRRYNVHMVIHYDPVVTDDPELNRLHESVKVLLSRIDPRLKPHDFRMVSGTGHTNLIFDISLPADLEPRKREIKKQLEQTLSTQEGTAIYAVITFDPAAFNPEEK